MPYRFINRIRLSPETPVSTVLPTDQHYVFHEESDGIHVAIGCNGTGNNQHDLVLQGEGYSSPEAALAAGKLFRQHLVVALARSGIGADLGGEDGAWNAETDEGKNAIVNGAGLLVRNSARIIVSRWSMPWQSASGSIESKPLEPIIDGAITQVSTTAYILTGQQRLAYQLFHLSFFESNAAARNIALVTAAEPLIMKSKRSAEIVTALDRLKMEVKASNDLTDSDKQTLTNALGRIKKEDISEAGQRLANEILNETYDGLPASDFFKRAYGDRSNLVHGNIDRPSDETLNARNPILSIFISDLVHATVFGPQGQAV